MTDYAKQFGLSESGLAYRVGTHGLEKAIEMGGRKKKGSTSPWRKWRGEQGKGVR
jgi:hypothetical protein